MKGIPAMKKDYVYAVTAVLFWSTTPAITKWLIFDIPNMEALSISSFFAFIFLLLMNTVNGTAGKWKHFSFREYMIMIGLGFIGLFLYSVLYYYGLSQLSSQEACILNYLWPMMLVIFSCPILKEKMSLIKIAAMGCSFMGILILSAGGTDHSYANAAPGMISCILSAACGNDDVLADFFCLFPDTWSCDRNVDTHPRHPVGRASMAWDSSRCGRVSAMGTGTERYR